MSRYPLLPTFVAGPNIHVPHETQAELRDALGRTHPSDVIAVYDPDGWHLEGRDYRAQLLRAGGVHCLAKKVSRAVVPPQHVLVLADLEEGTNVCVLPVDVVFGAPVEAPPSGISLAFGGSR